MSGAGASVSPAATGIAGFVTRSALPGTCAENTGTARLWVRLGHAVHPGPSPRLAPHSTAIASLGVGVDAPFRVRVADSGDILRPQLPVPSPGHPSRGRERGANAVLLLRLDLVTYRALSGWDERGGRRLSDRSSAQSRADRIVPAGRDRYRAPARVGGYTPAGDSGSAYRGRRGADPRRPDPAAARVRAGRRGRAVHLVLPPHVRRADGNQLPPFRTVGAYAACHRGPRRRARSHSRRGRRRFASPSHSSDTFRAVFGPTPSAFVGLGGTLRIAARGPGRRPDHPLCSACLIRSRGRA